MDKGVPAFGGKAGCPALAETDGGAFARCVGSTTLSATADLDKLDLASAIT